MIDPAVDPNALPDIAEVDGDSFRVGSERRQRVTLVDGRRGLFATLLPELVVDEAVRRRYVRDLQRRAKLSDPGLAEVVAMSVGEDGHAPWRLRVTPQGPTLAEILQKRAPLPVAEVAGLGAKIADVLHRLHAQGVVLRDLNPKLVVLTDDGPVMTDVGLARVDLLSTRTAASLVLEGSPYASPEQLRKTAVDQRSDLYGLGVIVWQALTGTLPFGEGLALLRDDDVVPKLAPLCPEAPKELARIVERCLAADPESRPASAAEVARVLRGGASDDDTARTTCQNCGASLRAGQRLCTTCGKLAISYHHAPDDPGRQRLVLVKVRERADQMAALRGILESVSASAVPPLNFIVGDRRMYSKEEQQRGLKLPLTLFTDLHPETATALRKRLEAEGVAVKTREPTSRARRIGAVVSAAVSITLFAGMMALHVPLVLALPIAALIGFAIFGVGKKVGRKRNTEPLLELRAGPAALPASDPLVARLAGLVHEDTPADVRERIGELALAVQNLVDHRAKLRDAADQAELDAVPEPIEPLIGLVERHVRRLTQIDADLAKLDEGALVRALAAARAREGTEAERAEILDGLDRLRVLEDERAGTLHRLLEAASLMRRAVDLGFEVQDAQAHHERQVQLALASLGQT